MATQRAAARPISLIINEAKPKFTQTSNSVNCKSDGVILIQRSKVSNFAYRILALLLTSRRSETENSILKKEVSNLAFCHPPYYRLI